MPLPASRRSGPSLKERAVEGALWAALRTWGEPLVTFGAFLLIVRRVGPEAYGIFGMAMLAIRLGELVVSETLADALIAQRALRRAHADTVFWTLLVVAVPLALAMLLLAAPLADFFDAPQVAPVTRALALVVPLSALAAVPNAMLRRRLRFRALNLALLASTVAGAALGLGAAFRGWGAYSLVVQLVGQKTAELVLLWTAHGARPRRAWQARRLGELLGFGLHTLGLRLTKYAADGLPRVFLGALFGPASLGLFQIAQRIHQVLRTSLVVPVTQVAMPVAARVRDEPQRLTRLVSEATALLALVAVPSFVGLSLVAPELLPLLLGDRWLVDAPGLSPGPLSGAALVQVGQVVPLAGLPICATTVGMATLRGTGHAGWRLALALAQLATVLALLAWLAERGLVHVALAVVATAWLQLPLRLLVLRRARRIPMAPQLRALAAPLVASAAMGAGVVACRHHLASLGPALLLTTEVIVGAALYLATLGLVARRALARAGDVLQGIRRRRIPVA